VGGSSSVSAQATPDPTQPATAAATQRATQRPTSTPAPTRRATQVGTPAQPSTPVPVFPTAPAPEAGSLGVTLSSEDPIIIRSVYPDGPAEKAGVQPGDEIVSLDGKEYRLREDLIDAIVKVKAGETITLKVQRGTKTVDIKIQVGTRRQVYCPLPEPKLTEGAALVADPLNEDRNWTLTRDSSEGVSKVVEGGKLTFKAEDPSEAWAGLVTLRSKAVLEYSVTVEMTQTGRAVGGLVLNFQRGSNYLLEFQPNGTWSMSATIDGQAALGGLSFGETTLLNVVDSANPNGTVTNTIKIVTDGNDIYFYFNGKFACGAPLYIFADPPLDAGTVGVFALVAGDPNGKNAVVFSKFTLTEVKK
jgi:membrane-associated protease RseP (regulator of RpoE activity)